MEAFAGADRAARPEGWAEGRATADSAGDDAAEKAVADAARKNGLDF